MRILSIQGSPRKKGNSATITKRFLEIAGERGAVIEEYRLNEMKYKACQACYACKTKFEHCCLKDDLTPVLKALPECDMVVISTPVYFADISAQTKAFIDRTFSFAKPDFHNRPDPVRIPPGKKMVWIITQEFPGDFYGDIFERYSFMFKEFAGFETYLIRGTGVEEPGEVINKPEIMAKAEEMAIKLVL
ncbi:flavodoxin family protein [bacterium]|nr:flavodoxin family protein [bacterium]